MRTAQITVTTSPTLLFDKSTVWRDCHIHTETGITFIGDENVSTTTGVKLDNNFHDDFQLPPTTALYAVTNAGTVTVYVWEIHG